jgi:hypothetical protein
MTVRYAETLSISNSLGVDQCAHASHHTCGWHSHLLPASGLEHDQTGERDPGNSTSAIALLLDCRWKQKAEAETDE